MFFVALDDRDEQALCNIGDAMASFLHNPDHHTKNLGPVSWTDVRALKACRRCANDKWIKCKTIIWPQKRGNSLLAMPPDRWGVPLVLSFAVFWTSVAFLIIGNDYIKSFGFYTTNAQIWKLGWGKAIDGIYVARQDDVFATTSVRLTVNTSWKASG